MKNVNDLIKRWSSERSFVNCSILNWLQDTIKVTNIKSRSPQIRKNWLALWHHLLSATFYFQLKDTIEKNRSAQMRKTWLSGLSLIICYLQTEREADHQARGTRPGVQDICKIFEFFFTLGHSFGSLPTELASIWPRTWHQETRTSVCVLDEYNKYI